MIGKHLSKFIFFFGSLAAIVFPLPVFAHHSTDVAEGLALLEKGRLEEAESCLQKARFADPADPRISYNLGIINFRKRDYSGAISYWNGALQKAQDPKLRSDILHNIGNAAYRTGNYAYAVEAYKSSLEIEENQLTRYNLEQAQRKLKEEIEQREREEQKNGQTSQPSSDKQEGKDSDRKSQGKEKQGKEGEKSGESGNNGRNDQQQAQQQGKNGKQSQTSEKQDSDTKNAKQPDSTQATPTASDTRRQIEPNASDSAQLEMGEEDRKDLAIPKEKKETIPPAEASQRARGLKNQKLNPYLVEKILKELEEREKQVQLRGRNEPRRRDNFDEMFDPFFMDPEELRDFMEMRQGNRPKTPSDKPDW